MIHARIRSLYVVALLLAALPAGRVLGQTTFATVTGAVTDPAGMAIPGATVEATHVESNYRYVAKTNEIGVYTLAQLREGEYVVRITAAGFKDFVAQGMQLVARDIRRLDIGMEIGAVGTSVEVKGTGITLIETETARISDTKTDLALKTLPLNTRNLTTFLGLTPGVIESPGDSSVRRFAGSQQNQGDAAIDGITTSNMQNGTQIGPLTNYIESFQEVRVDMANNSAEFGSVGQVTVISKSGTNRVHGSVFDYYSTPWFRARNPFSPARGTGVRHNPGVSVGGPVLLPKIYNGKDKTFYFFSFENARGSLSQTLMRPTVPLESWRRGDFSALLPQTVLRDPMASNVPFADNRIPASRLNPVSLKIQDRFYPLPNVGDPTVFKTQNYNELKTRSYDPSKYITLRLDHRINDASYIYGRFTWTRSLSNGFDSSLPTIGQKWQQRDTRGLNISYSYTIRSTLLNEFRWGYAYNNNPRRGPLMGKQLVQDFGLKGLVDNLPDINGVPKVGFSGIGLTGVSQTDLRDPGYENFPMQFQEHLSWFRGRHSIKAGFTLTRVWYADGQAPGNLFGNVSFSNRFTGQPYGDFLLGIPTTASRAFPHLVVGAIRWANQFFVTDEFKVDRRLTLTLGARYEYNPYWRETHGYMSMFDLASGKIVVPNGSASKVSPLMPRGYVDVIEGGQAGLPGDTLLRTDRNNIAPRIGLAYRPWGNRTVLRAGYGIFYDVVPQTLNFGGSPFIINEPSFTNPTPTPTVILPWMFPATGAAGPSTVGVPRAVRNDLRVPYSQQYNVTIEHQRWNTGFRASYIGTNSRQGEYSYNMNQPAPDTRPFIEKVAALPFPKYPSLNYQTNGLSHQYHSLTVEAKRQMARGLQYQLSWVWARDIGDDAPENAFDRRRERGVVNDIPTHRITGNFIYEMPFGRGKRFAGGAGRLANLLIGGWEISGIYSLYSGEFLTPSWTGPDPTGTRYTSSKTPAQVTLRPNELRDPNLPKDRRTLDRWFDVDAFTPPAAGAFGSAANGVIKGPGSHVWNAGLFKRFDLFERVNLRWELTASNFFNHPNWSNPGTNISSPVSVGVITGVGGVSSLDSADQRSFRMGARVEW